MSCPLTSYGIIALFVPISAAVAAATTPTYNDAWCTVGAGAAMVVAVLSAINQNRSRVYLCTVAISSFFVGAGLPGSVIWWKYPELPARLGFHAWMMMGFFTGLLGWQIVRMAQSIGPTVIKSVFGKLFPNLPNSDKDIES